MLESTEATLIKQVISGKSECYRPLVERYRKKVFLLAYSVLRNSAEAQDISQEAFLLAFKNLRELKDRKRFSAWLFGITRNLCYTALRKKRIEPIPLDMVPQEEMPNVVEMRPFDRSGSDILNTLMTKMETLPEKYRVLLTLKYLEDYSYQEISEMLDIPIDLIRSRLFEGRRMLREGFKEKRSIEYGG